MIDVPVWHYDGRNANKWQPRLAGDSQSFRLIGEGWEAGPYQWADLVALDVAGADAVFGHADEQGWRLGFAGDIPVDIIALLPRRQRYGGIIDHIGLGKASVVFACIAALAVFVVVKAPGWLAPFVPQSWEDNMGDAMVGDFGGRFCHSKEGDAALKALVAKLDPDARARSIEVANIPMVNAIALPGRRIILFDGLIKGAGSSDEVAGVLGHELGHVEHRHTLTALMRQLGLSVVLGGMDSTGGSQISTLLGLNFSREAEHEADLSALERMKSANISPRGTAAFFKRMGRVKTDEGRSGDDKPASEGAKPADAEKKSDSVSIEKIEQVTSWLASHPSSRSRYELFQNAAVKGHDYAPALSAEQWKALRSMCKEDKNVKSGWGFGF